MHSSEKVFLTGCSLSTYITASNEAIAIAECRDGKILAKYERQSDDDAKPLAKPEVLLLPNLVTVSQRGSSTG